MNEGWICPRCKKVNAPWVKSCDCGCPYQHTYIPVYPIYPTGSDRLWYDSVTICMGGNY